MALLPIYTFQVNLQTVDWFNHLPPDRHRQDQDAAIDDINQHSGNRSSILINGRTLKHGDKFTVCGQEAQRLFNLFTTGDNPTLVVCSADPEVDCVPDIGEEAQDLDSTATATATMLPSGQVFTFAPGSGYSVGDTLTVVGGTFSTAATLDVDSVKTILGQDEDAFGVGEGEGSFVAGNGYDPSNTITMNDGTVVTVLAIEGAESAPVIAFEITTISTIPHGTDLDVLTQSSTTGGGTGFSITLGYLNQGVSAASTILGAGELPIGEYTVLPSNPVSTTGAFQSPGGATFTITWGVRAVTVTDGGSGYTGVPDISAPDAGGGEEAGLTAVLTGGSVTSVVVVTPGGGYVARAVLTIAAP